MINKIKFLIVRAAVNNSKHALLGVHHSDHVVILRIFVPPFIPKCEVSNNVVTAPIMIPLVRSFSFISSPLLIFILTLALPGGPCTDSQIDINGWAPVDSMNYTIIKFCSNRLMRINAGYTTH